MEKPICDTSGAHWDAAWFDFSTWLDARWRQCVEEKVFSIVTCVERKPHFVFFMNEIPAPIISSFSFFYCTNSQWKVLKIYFIGKKSSYKRIRTMKWKIRYLARATPEIQYKYRNSFQSQHQWWSSSWNSNFIVRKVFDKLPKVIKVLIKLKSKNLWHWTINTQAKWWLSNLLKFLFSQFLWA